MLVNKTPLMKKVLLFILAIVILGGAYVWFFVYNKSHRDITQEQVSHVVQGEDFYSEFYENQEAATTKYTNQVVVVTGEVLKSEGSEVLLHPGIMCVLDSTQENHFDPGLVVRFKGRVSGFDDLFGEIRLDFCTEYRD
jgi:uncharacterized protein YxeA